MQKSTVVLYVHGKGGSASEADFYQSLFPKASVIGLDYRSETPWEAKQEFQSLTAILLRESESAVLIANSIGAYFSMLALADHKKIGHTYFISPIVDMELLIRGRMALAGVTEDDLKEKKTVLTETGESLSWDYLQYVRDHPVRWSAPTSILYGQNDFLTSFETISDFAARTGADLTVMPDGEHWFHTDKQMRYLATWIKESRFRTER